MTFAYHRIRWFLAAGAVAALVGVAARAWPVSSSTAPTRAAKMAPADHDPEKPVPRRAPPANLTIAATAYHGEATALLNASAEAWEKAVPTAVLLNRTPRIYQSEPVRQLAVPSLDVGAFLHSGQLFVRMRWTDATRNAPVAPPRKQADGNGPTHLYKRPTAETAAFADAAAVMVPQNRIGRTFPSLVMGDQHAPAFLYYWNASHGAEELSASGRATIKSSGKALTFRAAHADGKWTLVLRMPDPGEGCPMSFAVWDGELGDRDGMKFFSIWYVLTRNDP
jgi:hypothetical protein